MRFHIFIIIPLIALTACSLSPRSTENLENPEQTEEQINKDFERKQKCQTYMSEISKSLQKNDHEMTYGDISQYSDVDRIFYSKSRNSCLYVVTKALWSGGKPVTESFLLYDFLQNELLLSGGATYEQDRFEALQSFERGVEAYD